MLDALADAGAGLAGGALSVPLLEARGLGFDAGGHRLLGDLDLAFARGSSSVIIGPNGAGKSLLLRLLHGLIAPSRGQILWQGQPVTAAARRAQAMIFQRPVMLRRSVLANILFFLAVRGVPRARRLERALTILEEARLAHLADRPARILSGGEQQRLAIVRALACAPDLLFLDEPTSSLDPASTLAIEDLLLGARRRGITTVLVTHDRGQAGRLGDHAIFLQGGRIAEAGPVTQVLNRPTSAAAQAWVAGRLHLDP